MEAFALLVALFETRLFNFILRKVGHRGDAEDLTQETFLRAWRRIGSYRARWRFSTWLYTIAARLAISHARRPSGAVLRAEDEPAIERPGQAEDQSSIWQLVDEVLTEEQRTAVWLRYVEDMAIGEIAMVLGKSDVAVRVMLFRARSVLARHLAPQMKPEAERPAPPAPAPVVMTGAGRPAVGGVR